MQQYLLRLHLGQMRLVPLAVEEDVTVPDALHAHAVVHILGQHPPWPTRRAEIGSSGPRGFCGQLAFVPWNPVALRAVVPPLGRAHEAHLVTAALRRVPGDLRHRCAPLAHPSWRSGGWAALDPGGWAAGLARLDLEG